MRIKQYLYDLARTPAYKSRIIRFSQYLKLPIMIFHNHIPVSKLELNAKQLSALTNADLEMLGVRDDMIRAQMLAEFAQLPNQDYKPQMPRNASAADHQKAARQSAELVLANVYKHLNSLKESLSVVLLRLYMRPTENVLINDHMYASEAVLRTLDEFNRSVVGMEKRLLDMQYVSNFAIQKTSTIPKNYLLGSTPISDQSFVHIRAYRETSSRQTMRRRQIKPVRDAGASGSRWSAACARLAA